MVSYFKLLKLFDSSFTEVQSIHFINKAGNLYISNPTLTRQLFYFDVAFS